MVIQVQNADRIEAIYYTDPLCCWSWAAEPQWRRFRYQFRQQVSVRYCMGGLIPSWDNFMDTANEVHRPSQMGPLWMGASQVSGMPIHDRLWTDSPPASSYLSCIAVKCAALQSATAEERYLRMLREAVMVRGENISLQSMLMKVAGQLAESEPAIIDHGRFCHDLQKGNGVGPFRKDLLETQSLMITRFPTLVLRKPGLPALMLAGYRGYGTFLDAMRRLSVNIDNGNHIVPVDYRAYWGRMTDRELSEIDNGNE